MSNDEHAFAASNARCDGTLEERPQARCRHGQALAAGRHRVGRFPPGADLLDAEPGTSLRLIQTGKRAVVSFIQGRVRMHGQVGLAQFLKDQGKRMLSTLEPARERVVEAISERLQPAAGGTRFVDAASGQGRISQA